MFAKSLKIAGVLAIALAIVLPIVALVVVSDRLVVQIEPDRAEEVSPYELLADENAQLRLEVKRLGEATAQNFGTLATALAEDRAASEAALIDRIDRLQRKLAELERSIEARTRERQDRAVAGANDPEAPESTIASDTSAEAAEPPAAAAPSDEAPTALAERERRTSLLNFSVPRAKLDFGRRQRFSVIGSLSRVGFDGKSTLHDFTGVTSAVSGEFEVRFGTDDDAARGSVRAEAKTLRTGIEARDEEMLGLMRVDTHPELRFTLESFEPTGEATAEAPPPKGTVRGELSLGGVERDIVMPVQLSLDRGGRLVLAGQCEVKLSDYEIDAPSKLGVVEMEDTIKLWIALRARWLGGAKDDGSSATGTESRAEPK